MCVVWVAILASEMTSLPATTLNESQIEGPGREGAAEPQAEHESESGNGSGIGASRAQLLVRTEREMNRFHGALRDVRHALRDARRGALCRLESQMERDLSEEDGVLRDSLVLLEIERTILDERMSVERALAKILEERRRLARLVRDEPSMASDIRALARAFERVGRALGGSALGGEDDGSTFPEPRRPKGVAR